jgi:hypothetical protein
MLADAGTIEYDADWEVVKLRGQAADILQYLDLAV